MSSWEEDHNDVPSSGISHILHAYTNITACETVAWAVRKHLSSTVVDLPHATEDKLPNTTNLTKCFSEFVLIHESNDYPDIFGLR